MSEPLDLDRCKVWRNVRWKDSDGGEVLIEEVIMPACSAVANGAPMDQCLCAEYHQPADVELENLRWEVDQLEAEYAEMESRLQEAQRNYKALRRTLDRDQRKRLAEPERMIRLVQLLRDALDEERQQWDEERAELAATVARLSAAAYPAQQQEDPCPGCSASSDAVTPPRSPRPKTSAAQMELPMSPPREH